MGLLKKLFGREKTPEEKLPERTAFYRLTTPLRADCATIKLKSSTQLRCYYSAPWTSLFMHTSGASILSRGGEAPGAQVIIAGTDLQTDDCYSHVKEILPLNFPREKYYQFDFNS
ncbi:hypothetical protein KA107_00715 [Candidatus Pacearchaeota archaeon]|nr:hypothetical protein [Candidatus Pacearchaeota archaeon]